MVVEVPSRDTHRGRRPDSPDGCRGSGRLKRCRTKIVIFQTAPKMLDISINWCEVAPIMYLQRDFSSGHTPMAVEVETPTIMLVQFGRDDRARLAEGLRRDGMNVVEYAAAEFALDDLDQGLRSDLLVSDIDGAEAGQFVIRRAKAACSNILVILTPAPGDIECAHLSGAHTLVKPFAADKLSRFIRLVAARPALRATLQRLFRNSRMRISQLSGASQ